MRTLRIALLSLLLVAAGCTTAESGVPAPGAAPATSTTSASPGGPTSSTQTTPSQGPKRPKDIDLKKVNICKVVAKLPLQTFGLNTNRPPLAETSTAFPGNKECYVGGDTTNRSLLVTAVVDRSVDQYLGRAPAEDFDAQGYPLHVVKPTVNKDCIGVLDVHDGQFVLITYGMQSETQKPIFPQTTACHTVPKIAAAAIAALG